MATGSREDFDLAVVGPASERVRINAEKSAGLAEREPVAALAGRRLSGNTVNLGETHAGHYR